MKPILMMIQAWWLAALGERDRIQGHYAEADGRVRRALAILRRSRRGDGALAMGLWNTLGIVLKSEERFDRAAHAYAHALRLARRHLRANDPRFASLYHNMAGLEHARGRYEIAEPLARHGLSIRQAALADDHADVARDLAALGAILDGRGRHEEAEVMHRRALEIFDRRREHREIGYALSNLAACLYLQGRPEAAGVAAEAVRTQRRVLGPDHEDARRAQANLKIVESPRRV